MRLQSIIRQARSGELEKLSSKKKTDQVIVDYINLGMVALYTRFQLRTEEAVIVVKVGKDVYKMDGTDVDVVRSNETVEYISAIEAFDETGPIPINNDDAKLSIYTSSYNAMQIPEVEEGSTISVIYKAGPAEIEYVDDGNGNAVDAAIDLPTGLTEALLAYIGHRAYLGLEDRGEGEVSSADNYAKFEAACNRAEVYGVMPTDEYVRDVSMKGFV